MRILKYMLPLLALLIWSATVWADYDPTNPPEPGASFTLTTRCIPENSVTSITATAKHSPESTVSMSVSPKSGFRFKYWMTPEGEIISETQNFTYVMPDKDVELIAYLEYSPSNPEEPGTPVIKEYSRVYYEVSPKDAGRVSAYANGTYFNSGYACEIGSEVQFSASSHTNFRFLNWTCNGEVISESNRLELTVPEEDQIIVANFVYNPSNPEEPGEQRFNRTLTLKSEPDGATSSLSGAGVFLSGEERYIRANAKDYYTFINWTDDLGEVVSEESYFYYTMPNRNVTLTANYSYNYNPSSPGEPGEPIPPGSIAENMVAYPRFGMYDNTHVMILCETEGAVIHYTVDGSDPTKDSPIYSEPVFVPSNIVVKAIGIKEGMDDSPVRSYQVTAYHAAEPTFTLVNRKIVISSETPDAIIRYTLDFSEPNESSERFTTPFEPEENCRIKAYASKEGLSDSKVSVFVYRRADYTISAPEFSLNSEGKLVITPSVEGGTTYYTYTPEGAEPTVESNVYTAPITLDGNGVIKAFTYHVNYYDSPVSEYKVEGFVVERPTLSFKNPLLTFQTSTEGAVIRYTIDGSLPTEESTVYSAPIQLLSDCKVIAKGYKTNYVASDTISFTYVYRDYMLPTPTASFSNKALTLACSDTEAEIHYTTDGTVPTSNSTLYTGSISLTEDCTVKFIATRANFNDSQEVSFDFVVDTYRVSAPKITYSSESSTVGIECDTENVEIRYTTDGSAPTSASTLYEGAIQIVGNQTIKAIAIRSDLFDSEVVTLQVADRTVSTPSASFSNKVLTITCPDAEAQIHYTMDGSAPTSSSALYTGPISLTEDCTVKFIATRANFNDSQEGSFGFVVDTYRVSAPKITYSSESSTVGIECDTENVEIRYTTDGSAPTSASTLYEGAIQIVGNQTIKAIAIRSDLFDSEVVTLQVSDQTVPTPSASFSNKVLTITCPDAEAQIHYTMDGSAPTSSSPLYTGPISLTEDCTVRFIAIRQNFNDSEEGTFVFVLNTYRVETPTFSYDNVNALISIRCTTENAEIRYTMDGTDPTATSNLYEGPFAIIGNGTIKACAFRSGYFDSEIASLAINDRSVPVPSASFDKLQLTIACDDREAEIRYTIDGSVPTDSSTLYEGPFALTEDCTVNFIAIHSGFNNSTVASYNFVKSDYTVATPVFTYDRESGMISIYCATEGAEIRYTLDGTILEANTGTVYTGPIKVKGNQTFNTRAFKADMFGSETATFTVDDQKVPTPVSVFDNCMLTLSCPDTSAEIRYTLDGTEPTAGSTLYTAPISLTSDCIVRFIAILENFKNSEIAQFDFVYATYRAASPSFSYDPVNKSVTIASATANALIYYTTDGSNPTVGSNLYNGPVMISHNMTLKAIACRSSLFDSEISLLTINDQTVPAPVAKFENLALILSCEDEEAQILYTLDGSEPTVSSAVYVAPIELTEDCTVRFMAVRPDFNNSVVVPFNFMRADYTVATPVLTRNSENQTVSITTVTENAVIRYTTDGTQPTSNSGTLYSAPVAVRENMTINARAFRNDMFPSAVASIVINDRKVPDPVASYAAHRITLSCEDNDAQIHFTTDGSDPDMNSAIYSQPIEVNANCVIRFVAIRPNFNNSAVVSYEFTLADHQEKAPEVTKDYRAHKLVINHQADAKVMVSVGEEENIYDTPVSLDVDPDMRSMEIIALATGEDMYDSEALKVTIEFHQAPVISYDGHSVRISVNSSDSNRNHAELAVSFNDERVDEGAADISFDVSDFGNVTARAESDFAFCSETVSYIVDFFNTGEKAGVRNGHRLTESFIEWGDTLANYEQLEIVGDLDYRDLSFIRNLVNLHTLLLNTSSIAPEHCDSVLAGSRIETISLNSLPEGMLKGMPRLTSVVLTDNADAIPEGRISEAENPNILVYASSADILPDDVRNAVVNGVADNIQLVAGYPFNAYTPFTADKVEVTKDFNQLTEIGVCRGWETISLPFTPSLITHESKGEIVPFDAWDGNDEGPKPFWLYRAVSTGWTEAASIEPGVPYIISMPNCSEYIDAFNLNGRITFSAENVRIGDTETLPVSEEWVQGMEFVATYMPIERDSRNLSLNVEASAEEQDLPGSVFTPGLQTKPFGAYMYKPGSTSKMVVFGNWASISLPTFMASGVVVETIGNGALRITSQRDFHAEIYTPTGMRVRSVVLHAGETEYVRDLAKGIYFVAGSKIMIK